jgi:hypothetical protein
MKYEIKYKELEEFLKTLTYKSIKAGALKKAHAIDDIEKFKMDKSKITLDTVIFHNMPFLVDAIGNDLSICTLTKRKYKLPTGRTVNAKFDRTIIHDCREIFGSCVNDYFVIPEKFLIKLK